jgi:molecular chaperone Hsp33
LHSTTIEHYLQTSEQVASKLVLDVRDGEVAGILLQRMPGSGPEDDAMWDRVCAMLGGAGRDSIVAAARSNEGLSALFPTLDVRLFKASHPHFACTCSRQRVEGALRIAGRDEIEAALAEAGEVDVTCEFCGTQYLFNADEARAAFAQAGGAAPTRH